MKRRPRTPTLAELRDARRYRCERRVTHAELPAFLAEHFRRRPSPVTALHHALSLALALAVLGAGLAGRTSPLAWAGSLAAGVVCTAALLLPLHETAHAAAYRLLGARDLRWAASWRPFSAYVVAHGFVTGSREFLLVVLAPAMTIGPVLLALAVAFPAIRLAALTALLAHHLGSAGDFALLNFLHLHRRASGGAPLWVCDDAEAGETLFFVAAARAAGRSPP